MDLVHWENLEGAGGEEGGRGDRDGGKKKKNVRFKMPLTFYFPSRLEMIGTMKYPNK